jgi:hypothetical protein
VLACWHALYFVVNARLYYILGGCWRWSLALVVEWGLVFVSHERACPACCVHCRLEFLGTHPFALALSRVRFSLKTLNLCVQHPTCRPPISRTPIQQRQPKEPARSECHHSSSLCTRIQAETVTYNEQHHEVLECALEPLQISLRCGVGCGFSESKCNFDCESQWLRSGGRGPRQAGRLPAGTAVLDCHSANCKYVRFPLLHLHQICWVSCAFTCSPPVQPCYLVLKGSRGILGYCLTRSSSSTGERALELELELVRAAFERYVRL